MAETADAQNRDQSACARAAAPQRVERRDAGAHQRRRFLRREIIRDPRQSRGTADEVIGVAAVGGHARNRLVLAVDQVATPAGPAIAAVAAEPADADSLAHLPAVNAFTDSVDDARTSWPGTTGNVTPGKCPSFAYESLWQTPHAWTLTRTCPGAGSGVARSRSSADHRPRIPAQRASRWSTRSQNSRTARMRQTTSARREPQRGSGSRFPRAPRPPRAPLRSGPWSHSRHRRRHQRVVAGRDGDSHDLDRVPPLQHLPSARPRPEVWGSARTRAAPTAVPGRI